ncbi:MAG: lipoate--protein ligase [Bacillota bacterium]|nr:lipoate--protein ligase [Bacillota bacterium]
MRYIQNNSNDPYFNLALEEYAFTKLTEHDKIFILWINAPTVVVGKFQNTVAEINLKYIEENGVSVVRRNSGGGAVYHDLGNLNYTIISSEKSTNEFNFEKFSKPIVDLLATLQIEAQVTGRNDIGINGKKICGNAQYIKKNRILHHGCILFDVNLEHLQEALRVSADKIESKGLKSVRSRVDNISYHLKEAFDNVEFKNRLLQHMLGENPDMVQYVLSEEEIREIEELRDRKFRSWDWNFGKSPDFTISKSNRFPAGKIECFLNVEEGIIEDIRFFGDFFSNRDIEDVAKTLIGVRYEKSELKSVLTPELIREYFPGFDYEEVLSCII